MRYYIPIIAVCLCSAPAFGQSAGEKTGVNTLRDVAPSTADFIKGAASSDMFEIQSSQMAADKSDAGTKSFATQMIADHQKTTDELKKMIDSNAVQGAIPPSMSSAQQAMLDKLKTLSGTDFTKQYVNDQIAAHDDAVALFHRYAEGGAHAGMKEWAIKTEPTLQNHLMMAQALNK